MNQTQRMAVGYFALSVVIGIASAPLHGATFKTGLLAGLVTFLIMVLLTALVVWMLVGSKGVKAHSLKLIEHQEGQSHD